MGRVVEFVHNQEYIRALIGPAIEGLRDAEPEKFRKLLEIYLQDKPVRSIRDANESIFQCIVEILLDERKYRIPELLLVVDGTKERRDGRFGFPDIFLLPTLSGRLGVVLELKYMTLEGLWRGSQKEKQYALRRPTHEELAELADVIRKENEEELWGRRYGYFTKKGGISFTTVRDVMEDAKGQLKRYLDVIKEGKAKGNGRGVADNRVMIAQWQGHDSLFGYVFIGIGGRRVLVSERRYVQTFHQYQRTWTE